MFQTPTRIGDKPAIKIRDIKIFLVLEDHAPDAGARKDVLKEPLMVSKGYVEIPSKPAWDVELNEEAFKRYSPKVWKRPTRYRPDGSISFQ